MSTQFSDVMVGSVRDHTAWYHGDVHIGVPCNSSTSVHHDESDADAQNSVTVNSKYLKDISLATVAELFDIPLFEERDVYGGAIFMSTPGPLHPLGTMLQQVLNETGRILEREGCPKGLGEWIVRTVTAIPGMHSRRVMFIFVP